MDQSHSNLSKAILTSINYLAERQVVNFVIANKNIAMLLSQSINSLDRKIIQELKPPKAKARLASFRRYYTRSLETTHSSSFSPKKRSTPIDGYLIEKIQQLAPSKINRQLSKTQSKSQKAKTEKTELVARPSFEMESMMQTLRRKSLRITRQEGLVECRIKKQVNRKPKQMYTFFDSNAIKWAERKWGNGQLQGKYSQKLHPICLIYEQFAEKASKNCFSPPNPFEGYEHIQF